MGYQVGNSCHPTREAAENAYFSAVSPVITENGVKQLVYKDKSWYFGSQKLNAYLPQCDEAQNYLAGYEMMSALFPTAITLMVAKVIIDLLKKVDK